MQLASKYKLLIGVIPLRKELLHLRTTNMKRTYILKWVSDSIPEIVSKSSLLVSLKGEKAMMGIPEKEKKEKAEFLGQLGAHISKLRVGKNVSVSELARRCFMDKPNLIRIEKGRVNPSIYALKRIADALEIPLKDLLNDFDSHNREF